MEEKRDFSLCPGNVHFKLQRVAFELPHLMKDEIEYSEKPAALIVCGYMGMFEVLFWLEKLKGTPNAFQSQWGRADVNFFGKLMNGKQCNYTQRGLGLNLG